MQSSSSADKPRRSTRIPLLRKRQLEAEAPTRKKRKEKEQERMQEDMKGKNKDKKNEEELPVKKQKSRKKENIKEKEPPCEEEFSDEAEHAGAPFQLSHFLTILQDRTDPTAQLICLQELSEILGLATEETFSRGFNSPAFVRVLIGIIRGPDLNNLDLDPAIAMGLLPELILMSCRCLSNMIETNPGSVMHIVQCNGPDALIGKLFELEYIDLAEQVLLVLDKISSDYPTPILKCNGLLAVIQYIDFFNIHVQRIALKIVSNTLQSLPRLNNSGSGREAGEEAFKKISGVFDAIIRFTVYSDQKMANYAVQSISRIVNWVSKDLKMLENLFENHLKSLIGLLGSLIESKYSAPQALIFSQTLKIFSILAKTSSKFASELINDHNIITLIHHHITGSLVIPGNVVQFTVTTPADHILDVLGLLHDLLPQIPAKDIWLVNTKPPISTQVIETFLPDPRAVSTYQKLILPILFDLFSNTAHISIRSKTSVCVCKAIHFSSDAVGLKSVLLGSRTFGRFVVELLSFNEAALSISVAPLPSKDKNMALNLILAGLVLVSFNIDDEEFQSLFLMEGVVNELNAIFDLREAKIKKDANDEVNERIKEDEKKIEVKSSKEVETLPLTDDEPASSGKESEKESDVEKYDSSKDDDSNCGHAQIGSMPLSSTEIGSDDGGLPRHFQRLMSLMGRISQQEGGQSSALISGLTTESYTHQACLNRIYALTTELKDTFALLAPKELSLAHLNSLLKLADTEESQLKCLDSISSYLANARSTSDGITCFELTSSGLVEAFIDFLTAPGPNEISNISGVPCEIAWLTSLSSRILAFIKIFLSVESSAFESLVASLLESISRSERFRITSGAGESPLGILESLGLMASSGLSSLQQQLSNPIAQFGRQIRLNISPENASNEQVGTQTIQVSIQAVASYHALESYIRLRLDNPTLASSVQSTNKDVFDIIVTEDEEKEGPSPPLSFARAASSGANNFNIKFFLNGVPVSQNNTIFGSLFKYNPDYTNNSAEVWSKNHKITYIKDFSPESEEVPPTPLRDSVDCPTWNLFYNDILSKPLIFPKVGLPLFLTKLLYNINMNCSSLLDMTEVYKKCSKIFLNAKLTSKVNRQIDDLVSRVLPQWCVEIVTAYSFLVPFSTRTSYLKGTSFGYARSILQWQQSLPQNSNSLGRVPRQKVRVGRESPIASMYQIMSMQKSNADQDHSILDVEFMDEVGTGLGPTLEFFALVSSHVRRRKGITTECIQIWRGDGKVVGEYLNPADGLYPCPITQIEPKIIEFFTNLGKFVAKALFDSRTLDLIFDSLFLEQVFYLSSAPLRLLVLNRIDSALCKSLDLIGKSGNVSLFDLDFTLPGFSAIELVPNGANVKVTDDNFQEYLDLVIEKSIGSGVDRQINAFRNGFNSILPVTHFSCFTGDELSVLIAGESTEDWSIQALQDSCKADHGYLGSSRIITYLFQFMTSLSIDDRRDFLRFITGSPKLPIGGFKGLNPSLTIVRRTVGENDSPDSTLPSVMTCANYLKVPEYSSREVLDTRFRTAIKEGRGSFHLS